MPKTQQIFKKSENGQSEAKKAIFVHMKSFVTFCGDMGGQFSGSRFQKCILSPNFAGKNSEFTGLFFIRKIHSLYSSFLI